MVEVGFNFFARLLFCSAALSIEDDERVLGLVLDRLQDDRTGQIATSVVLRMLRHLESNRSHPQTAGSMFE